MDINQKIILLHDLCNRLPYHVKCQINDMKDNGNDNVWTLSRIVVDYINGHLLDFIETKDGLDMQVYLSEVKPYLLPLSSITQKQKNEINRLINCHITFTQYGEIVFPNYEDNNTENWQFIIQWCYKNNYDISGLIPMGLAINATNLGIY